MTSWRIGAYCTISLRPYGDCDLAADGLEAVAGFEAEFMEENPYHLVLLDIMMPKMDGQEALQKIRTFERKQRVSVREEAVIMMVTAMVSSQTQTNAYQYGGCSDYIIKPVKPKLLLDKLRKHRLIF